MSPLTINKGNHRLTVKDEPERVIEIDSKFELTDGWFNAMRVRSASVPGALEVLEEGELCLERIRCEANGVPLPEKVEEAAGRIPSLDDIVRDRGVFVVKGEYAMRILPWTDDEGWTQFAIDVAYWPKEGEPEHLAQLGGSWEIRLVMEMLREAVQAIEQQ